MVKTRTDLKGVRVSAKAPRKMSAPTTPSAGSPARSSKKYDGGNSYFPRETPEWQKQITKFFPIKTEQSGSSSNCDSFDSAGSSESST